MSQLVLNATAQGGVYFLYALALALVLFPLRIFHAALGGVAATAGYAFTVTTLRGWPATLAVLAGLAQAVLAGLVLEVLVYRPLADRGATQFAVAISSFAAYTVFVNLLASLFGNESLMLRQAASRIDAFGGVVTTAQGIDVVIAAVCFVGLALALKTRWGLTIRAMQDNPDLLRSCRWDTSRIRIVCIVSSSLLAGVAGCLTAVDTGVEPGLGMAGMLAGLVVVVAVGSGGYLGLLPVAVLLALLQQAVALYLSPRWESAVAFLALAALLAFRPAGYFSRSKRVEVLD